MLLKRFIFQTFSDLLFIALLPVQKPLIFVQGEYADLVLVNVKYFCKLVSDL